MKKEQSRQVPQKAPPMSKLNVLLEKYSPGVSDRMLDETWSSGGRVKYSSVVCALGLLSCFWWWRGFT